MLGRAFGLRASLFVIICLWSFHIHSCMLLVGVTFDRRIDFNQYFKESDNLGCFDVGSGSFKFGKLSAVANRIL